MKLYQDLDILGTREQLARFIDQVEQLLSDGWERSRPLEKEVLISMLGDMYCFHCTASGTRPESNLWLAKRPDGNLYVSNILSAGHPSLRFDRYNSILQEFYLRFVSPAARLTGIDARLGPAETHIEDFLSVDTAALLRNFSRLANRSFPYRPDRQRWNEFVTAAHRDGATLSSSLLERWLVEEEGWSQDQASELGRDYERARDLLNVYESQPA